jgi:hypothetical protein
MYKLLTPKQASYSLITNLKWLDWLSIALCVWLMIYPHPYKPIFTIVISLPLIGFALNRITHPSIASLITESGQTGREKEITAYYVAVPSVMIFARVLLDYSYDNTFSIIKIGTITFVLLTTLLLLAYKPVEKANTNRFWIYLIIIGNIALYSYASTFAINCLFDNSAPKVYKAKVIAKHWSKGKSTTYYLTVPPWGDHQDEVDIPVTQSQYNETDTGRMVKINHKEGLLNIPWYYIK